jgi:hypothetical protein
MEKIISDCLKIYNIDEAVYRFLSYSQIENICNKALKYSHLTLIPDFILLKCKKILLKDKSNQVKINYNVEVL